MPTPYENKEFIEELEWETKSKHKKLSANKCIASWTDICGFGNLLNESKWDLSELQKKGVIELLSDLHSIAGSPSLVNIDPLPNDKIIVLNDGIARTVDLKYKDKMDSGSFLYYLRTLITNHYILLLKTKIYNVGVRTILAGGERIQYSRASTTGHSVLYYDGKNISDFGKKILDTTFVYNPAEFQMNTAFAKAFTIDSLGSRNNIKVNGLYIEQSFFTLVDSIKNIRVSIENNYINIFHKEKIVFKFSIAETLQKDLKGIEVVIYHIDKYFICANFDGKDVDFDMYREK